MLDTLGRGLTFILGSVIGGLALAFLIVALRPELIRGPVQPASPLAAPAPASTLPPPLRVTYAAAVERSAPVSGRRRRSGGAS